MHWLCEGQLQLQGPLLLGGEAGSSGNALSLWQQEAGSSHVYCRRLRDLKGLTAG